MRLRLGMTKIIGSTARKQKMHIIHPKRHYHKRVAMVEYSN